MIKVAMTIFELYPLDVIRQSGGVISVTGAVGDIEWARYKRAAVDMLAVWRTVCIPPDGYDCEVVFGQFSDFAAIMSVSELAPWARNVADLDAVLRARDEAMTDTEKINETDALWENSPYE